MKKIFIVLWWISISVLSLFSFTFAYTQEQLEAYQWAYKYGITTQPTIEAANLEWSTTREAFAKMVVNYLENVVWIKQANLDSCSFPDESKITDDLKAYTKKSCAYEIMGSNWKNFNPTQPIDRAQLWTVFSRILWGDRHNVDGKWYYVYHVNALKDAGIMDNISNIVENPAKRWDVLIMFKRMYEKFGWNIYLNGWNPISTNKETSSDSDIIDYNDSLVDIFDECDGAMEGFIITFNDENSSVDSISKSLKSTISTCETAKDKASKVWNIDGDNVLKDAVVAVISANINYLKTFETTKPYWKVDKISEDNEEYKKITEILEKKSYIVEKSTEYLMDIQEDFAKKHWFKLDNQDYNTSSSISDDIYVPSNNTDVKTNWNVVYSEEDETLYGSGKEFLELLKDTAEKKWETDLVKYLEVEIKYYELDLDKEFEFDPDEFFEEIWIDRDNIDPDSLTKKEKEEIIKNFWIWVDGVIGKAKGIYNNYSKDLKDVVKNIKNDKFWLSEKYNKTQEYIEYTNSYLDNYWENISSLLKNVLLKGDDENSQESMFTTLSILTLALDFKSKSDEYNKFIDWWTKDTIDLLWWKLTK